MDATRVAKGDPEPQPQALLLTPPSPLPDVPGLDSCLQHLLNSFLCSTQLEPDGWYLIDFVFTL